MSIAQSPKPPVDLDSDSSASSVGSPESETSGTEEEEDSVDGPRKKVLTQETVDERVFAFIVTGMIPWTAIDCVHFHGLMKVVMGEEEWDAAGLHVATADEFRQMVHDRVADFKKNVKEVLKRQSLVATTFDVWKTNEKTFGAVTAHWIDESTMARFNCLLDVREVYFDPSGECVARILYKVHSEFGILGKVAHTTVGGGECNSIVITLMFSIR
jgi:hypothetical protein